MQAIRDDSAAFGLGSLAGALAILVLIGIAVDLLNRVALNQVRDMSPESLIVKRNYICMCIILYRLAAYENFSWRPYFDRICLGLIHRQEIISPVK